MFLARGSLFSNDCLWQHHFFRDRDARFVELLSRDVKVEVFKPGEIIMKEGARGSSMYILRRGEVEILAGGMPVTRLGSGSVFGEIVLLGVSDRRTATVKAIEFSDCRVVHRTCLQRLLRLFPRERDYFKSLANDRLAQLHHVAPDLKRRIYPPTPRGQITLPDVNASDVDDAAKNTALTDFSHFFEKPDWRSGMKRNRPGQTVTADLGPLKELRPQLPPLITRKKFEGKEVSESDDLIAISWNSLTPRAAEGIRAPVPGLAKSARPRFFMYDKSAARLRMAGSRTVSTQATPCGGSSVDSALQSPVSSNATDPPAVLA